MKLLWRPIPDIDALPIFAVVEISLKMAQKKDHLEGQYVGEDRLAEDRRIVKKKKAARRKKLQDDFTDTVFTINLKKFNSVEMIT